MQRLALLASLILLGAACGSTEPESAANKADRLEREIAERANALNAQVENELAQTEQRLEAEAAQALNSLDAAADNSLDEAEPAAAGQNKLR